MKKIIFMLLVLVASKATFGQVVASNLKAGNSSMDLPVFRWSEPEFNFGKVKLNVPVSHEFNFTNTGKAPLIISSVKASCGCTVTEYSKDPIAPGQKGFVKATYNAAKEGAFSKTITVNANTEDLIVQLTIKGEVVN